MSKFTSAAVGLMFILAASTVAGNAQPSETTWKVTIGGETPDHRIQAQLFAPSTITIDAGDTVTWTMGAAFDHTVTFLGASRPPDLFIPENNRKLLLNPLVALPQGLKTYTGKGIANSGVLMEKGKSYSLTFTKPGSYAYVCMLHPGMTGTVVVRPAGSPLPMNQAAYDKKGAQQVAAAITKGQALLASAKVTKSKGAKGTVYASPMLGSLASHASVIGFAPEMITVKAGDTVRWVMKDPIELHTVTFSGSEPTPEFLVPEPQPKGPPKFYFNSKGVYPAGGPVQKGSGLYNSGFMNLNSPGPKTYSLTFTRPGTYTYWCVVHVPQGMKGVVNVQ